MVVKELYGLLFDCALPPLLPRNAVEEEVRVLRLWFMYPPRSVNCADPDISAGVWSDTTTQDVTGLPRSNEDGVPCLVCGDAVGGWTSEYFYGRRRIRTGT